MLALNLGSLFNHHDSPNLDYRLSVAARTVEYYAARPISPSDELCIYYGSSLWFPVDTEPSAPVEEGGQEREEGDLGIFGFTTDI